MSHRHWQVCSTPSSEDSVHVFSWLVSFPVHRREVWPGWKDRVGCPSGEPVGPGWEHQTLDRTHHEADWSPAAAKPKWEPAPCVSHTAATLPSHICGQNPDGWRMPHKFGSSKHSVCVCHLPPCCCGTTHTHTHTDDLQSGHTCCCGSVTWN